MMMLNTPPGPDEPGLINYYRRCATEGSVFSGTVGQQSYGVSDSFDPAWSVASICWCAGGTETYEFSGRETIRLRAGTALAIGENERYAWSTEGERPFFSSMIVFPIALTRSLAKPVLQETDHQAMDTPVIATSLFRPSGQLIQRMDALARTARTRQEDAEMMEEQVTLVAAELKAVQIRDSQRPDRLESVKRTTREELCRRLRRAVTLMHDAYADSTLDLNALAREACIARHHFVRVFAAAYGVTPLQYLGELRMEAAARLLESMEISATEVAKAVGFKNRSAFHRRFRKHFGKTPTTWRIGRNPTAQEARSNLIS